MISNTLKSQKGQSQNGLALIELMIAITLSLFIVAAMISLFVNSKQNYRLNENMSRLQENARFAVAFISRDIRMAGYRACLAAVPLADAITGENNTETYDTGNATDTVTIKWQADDCAAEVIRTYSIQASASGGPALFRSDDEEDPEELVEGIEDLQILYGQDTDNDSIPNYFVDSTAITDMAQAVSVRITLVARTLESNMASDGGRITRPFTSTVTLRNRLP